MSVTITNPDKESQIIKNKFITPDGTPLISRNRHDFNSHKDTITGVVYQIDGGLNYFRNHMDNACSNRSVVMIFDDKVFEPYVNDGGVLVFSDKDHDTFRKYFEWGTNGVPNKSGKQSGQIHFVAVKDMSNDHIQAIIDTQTQIPEWLKNHFIEELKFRKNKII